MNGYYVSSKESLVRELEERREDALAIREKINIWMEEEYGVPGFSALVKKYFGETKKPMSVLFRHIHTVRIEDLMCALGSFALGYKPVAYSFPRDGYCSRNWSKKSLVKIPWIAQGSKKVLIEYEKVIPSYDIEGRILARLLTESGESLPVFHQKLRDKVFTGNNAYPVNDVSSFLDECAKLSIENGKYCSYIFVRKGDREIKTEVNEIKIADLDQMDIRPSAEWYYTPYLSMFINGQRFKLETFDNVPEFQPIFHRAMDDIKKKTGLYPLIVKTPYQASLNGFSSKFLLEYPRRFLEDGNLFKEGLNAVSAVNENLPGSENPEIVFQRSLKEIMERI